MSDLDALLQRYADDFNASGLLAAFGARLSFAPGAANPLRASATVQLSMRFERPCTGDHFRCEGWVEQGGKSLVFTAAHILDAAGEICARAEGVVRVSQKPWAKGASPGSALEP